MLRISKLRVGWNYSTGDGAQSPDDISRLVEPPHMGVAGGKVAISRWEARIVLDGEEEIWHRRFVSPADKMGLADNSERKADSPTGAETKRGLDMLDRKIR